MLYLTHSATIVTGSITIVVVSVIFCHNNFTTSCTLIPVLGVVVITWHIIVLNLASDAADITIDVAHVIVSVSYLTLCTARVTCSVACVIVNVSTYLTHLAAYVTIGITYGEEYVSGYFALFLTYVADSVTYVVVGMCDGACLATNVAINITLIGICVRCNVATLVIVVTDSFVPMALCVRGPFRRILMVM